jgi:hypothetical protein
MATSPRFEETGGGAAFGNPNLVRQGAKAGATQVPSPANPNPGGYTPAPSNATAAPKGSTNEIFTGLAEALNTYQQRLVKQGKYEVADIYEIEFTPGMGSASMQRPGVTDKKKVPMQEGKTAKDKLNQATQSVNAKGRSMEVNAGMQIVQFIDQVMKNSTYIIDQQLVDIDAAGNATPNGKPTTGQTAWYKISVQATQLGYDKKRHDHAYRMKFVISPYAINTMQSEFFPNSRFRGAHKRYNYWFTGANAEILNFEQEFNNLYRLIISGIAPGVQKQARTDFRDQYRRTALATSEQSSQGADGYGGEPGANAADFLYSPTDQAKVRLRIVGDPAWMQQGEVAVGVNSRTFNFEPFNTDGTINYDSQEVVFDISWNRPADYNFDTGLMDVKNTKNNEPQENATYTAIKCKNIFSKGRFEQELEGRLLIEFDTKTGSSTAPTPARPATPTATQNTRTPLQAKGENLIKNSSSNLKLAETLVPPTPNNSLLSPTVAREVTTLPAKNPAPPTSNGDIVGASPTTFAQSTAQGQQRQNNRLVEALAGQVKNNQITATEK